MYIDDSLYIDYMQARNEVIDETDEYIQEFIDEIDSDDIEYEKVTEEE